MMLFNEVYGVYYKIVFHLLRVANEGSLDEKTLKKIIVDEGFEESLLHLYPKIVKEDKSNYQLFNPVDYGYLSILNESPKFQLTHAQKTWFKALLMDKRVGLFFDDELLNQMHEAFTDVKPLLKSEDYWIVGKALDGDPFESETYRKNFKIVREALSSNTLMKITFINRYGKKRQGYYAPYRIEYSVKDDKFRLNAVLIDRGKMINYSRVNIARIKDIELIHEANIPDSLDEFIYSHKVKEPVTIRLMDKRNGFDRCFIHLSNYERKATYNKETGMSLVQIYYYDFEETELLITLLSYGSILEVMGPDHFRNQVKERILKQKKLFTAMTDNP